MAKPDRRAVAAAVHRSSLRLLRALRHEDVAMGLGTARASVLSVIVFAGPLGIGRLAEIEQVRAPTMTRLVDRLEAAGLVQRIRDPKDRRNVGVHATPAGRRILEAGRARRVDVLATAMLSLPEGDLRALEKSAAILEAMTLEM